MTPTTKLHLCVHTPHRCRLALVMAALTAALAWIAPMASASPPRPIDLRVAGGRDAWHPEDDFELEWTNPSTGSGPPIAAVHYRVRDPLGTPVEEEELGRASDGIAGLTVPRVPGVYTFEVWLENAAEEQGPAATTFLRFDDVRPAAIEAPSVPSWIGRATFPLRIRLGHPPGPAPLSGIHGYATVVDAKPDGAACAAPDRCTDAETTLRAGVGDDTLTIGVLPEGTSYLHAVAVSGSGMKSASSSHAVLRVDTTNPSTSLTGAPGGWTNRAVRLIATATDAGSGMVPRGETPPPFTAIRVDDGAPTIAAGNLVATSVIGEDAHRIAYYARDAAGNVDDGREDNGVVNQPPRTSWVRIDRDPPSVAFTNSQEPRDPDLLRVRIADPLSGPDPSRGWIGVRRAGSGDRFAPLPAAPPADGELRARWSSDAHPAGEYEFEGTAYDAAGNITVTRRRKDGTAMILSNPLKAVTDLEAGFRGRLRQREVPYGRGVLLSGRLSTGVRTPLNGMPVRVIERFAGLGQASRVSTVRTGAHGRFSLRLAPGPSREITAAFEGSPTLSRSASDILRLGVRSAVRFRASAAVARVGGAPLVFRGRVAAPPGTIPDEGKSVQLQFRLPGLPWSEFRTIQTDRRGRFRYAYRFSDDDSRGARFQFRAFAPAQDDWPYEPGGSKPVLVRGI
jgi:hypothetical protein